MLMDSLAMYFLSCITLFIFLSPLNAAMGYSRKNPNKEEGWISRAISMLHGISRDIKEIAYGIFRG